MQILASTQNGLTYFIGGITSSNLASCNNYYLEAVKLMLDLLILNLQVVKMELLYGVDGTNKIGEFYIHDRW
jgi:hypothetical protein